jgi:type I restriction enzyme, S subunit
MSVAVPQKTHNSANTQRRGAPPWIGRVPDHWTIERLRWTVTSCQNGIWGDEPDGVNDIPCVRVADFDRTAFRVIETAPTVRAVTASERTGRVLQRGDLLLEKSGGGELQPVGAVMLYDRDEPAVCSNFVARMRVARGFDPRFLTFVHASLYAARVNTRSIKQTTGIQNLDSMAYLDERAAWPPLPEQRAIAAWLDDRTKRIDELVAAKRRLIDLLAEQRAALITQAVTKGLNPDAPMKPSGIDWLGDVPRHWEVKRLKYLFKNLNSRRVPLEAADRSYREKVYPYYGASGVIDAVDEYIFDEPLILVAEDGANLLSRSTPLAFVATGKYWVNNHAHILRPRFGPIRYWESVLQSFDFTPLVSGSAQPKLTLEALSEVWLPLPPINEQDQIVAMIERVCAGPGGIDSLATASRSTIDQLIEYRQSLITAAVTGKIDVLEGASA